MDKCKDFFFTYNTKSRNIKFYIKSNFKEVKKKKITFFILGKPKIDYRSFFLKFQNNKNFLKKINGEFLMIVKYDKKILIINDRFTSIPLYYVMIKDEIFFSNNYISLFKKIKNKAIIKLLPENFLEFLNFRKLHGDKTFDDKIKFLNYSSILKISSRRILIDRYWFPNFDDKYKDKSLNFISNLLIKKTLNSISNKIETKKKVNLFLSGGLDTRFILAALIKLNLQIKCFTFGFDKKGEYKYSRLLTKIFKIKHYFMKIDKEELIKNCSLKLNLSSGMYNHYINFFNCKKKLNTDSIILHGHGFDYLFQGMYLPNKRLKVYNRDTYLKFPLDMNNHNDVIKYYFFNSSYKTKNFDLNKYVKKKYRKKIEKKLIFNLKKDFKETSKLRDNNHKWEYILIKNLSRHYSHIDVLSISKFGNEKTISFDNELFDFYLSLNRNDRFDGRIMRNSLKILNKDFSNIPSANHGQKIIFSSKRLFFNSIFRKIFYWLSKNKKYLHPKNENRTFPNLDDQIKQFDYLKKNISLMLKEKNFRDFFYFLNFEKFEEDFHSLIKGRIKGKGQLLILLLHLYKLKKRLDF